MMSTTTSLKPDGTGETFMRSGPLARPAGLPCGALAKPVSPLGLEITWNPMPAFSSFSKPQCGRARRSPCPGPVSACGRPTCSATPTPQACSTHAAHHVLHTRASVPLSS